jgi:phage shock protein C
MTRKTFQLDKENGKIFGVCAGMAEMTGWDVTVVRAAAVVSTLIWGWTLLIYFVIAFAARASKGSSRRRERRQESARVRGGSTYDLKHTMSDIDRRMAEIDSYVAGADSRLAREIEELR